ncbi:DUF2061 domain-containing protein [Pseudomonas stutzeri]|uniref:DUF2061 domain-containing protein n=1 Tax=Stutzerimonas stutzeri TaxID=316 RepID=A0A2N8SNF8_STUST|nr:DUF2061 domain-containing protein [Stutzerimonas stutzeri]EQM76425.1 membrane protein [Stutzerimonas stutzeri MF28]MCQ4250148.1 DUF2061 domain-containing protein [Stutzerimonas stutzeri]PNG04016.1 DUF2061 domain-containing protein [Stutzerimonas stutzeri]
MLKTVTFTLMHFCIAFSVTYALTGSAAAGGLVAAIEPLCNSVGFYLHERVWQRLEKRQRRGDEIPSHAWLHHHA